MEKNAAIFRGGKRRTMIWKNAEIFNVEELILQEDGFYATRRLKDPEQSYEKDNIFVQNKTSHGVEVRFRLNGGAARLVCRTAAGAAGKCCVFIGRTLLGEYAVTDRPTEIAAEMPAEETVRRIEKERRSPYGGRLFRFVFDGAEFFLKSLEGDLVPPREEDVPKVRGIVYGSSVTAGYFGGFLPALSYVRVMERALGAEIENLGFAGVCLAEEWIARRIAARGKYDFVALELGVNVMYRMETAEFSRRVNAFLSSLTAALPKTPVVCTDCFPFAYWQSGISEEKYRAYKSAVREAVKNCGKSACYADGETLLAGMRHLAADGVHPDAFGHIEIGKNFARAIAAHAGIGYCDPMDL